MSGSRSTDRLANSWLRGRIRCSSRSHRSLQDPCAARTRAPFGFSLGFLPGDALVAGAAVHPVVVVPEALPGRATVVGRVPERSGVPTLRLLGILMTTVLASGAMPSAPCPSGSSAARSPGRASTRPPTSSCASDAVNGRTAWVGGSAGGVWRTTDGGRTWDDVSPAGADGLLFRDIEARNAHTALALSIGRHRQPYPPHHRRWSDLGEAFVNDDECLLRLPRDVPRRPLRPGRERPGRREVPGSSRPGRRRLPAARRPGGDAGRGRQRSSPSRPAAPAW